MRWRRRRATTRAAGSGASTRSSRRRAGSPAVALDPSGSRPTAGRSAPPRPRSIRECAARALAGDSLRSICTDLNDARDRDGDREAVESADAAADADLGPDQRPARAPRRDRGQGRVGGDHHAGRDAAAAREAARSGAADEPSRPPLPARAAAPLRPLRHAARLSPARRRHPPLRLRERPGLRRLRQDRRSSPSRSSSSWSRPSCTGSTRPSLPHALNGSVSAEPDGGRVAGGDRAARRRSWTSWPSVWAEADDRPQRVADGPRADREAARRWRRSASPRSTARPR